MELDFILSEEEKKTTGKEGLLYDNSQGGKYVFT